MLKLVLGRAGSGKTTYAMTLFRARMEAGVSHLYFVVPEQYSHDAERQLLTICGDSLSLFGEVLSFSRMCSRVFAELGGIGAKNLDSGGRLLLMSRAVAAVSGRLGVYGGTAQTPEFLEKLVTLSKEFKSACLTPELMTQAASAAGSPLSEKLSDLALIFGAYDAHFTRETANPDDRLDRLVTQIGESRLFDDGHIFFDGFTDFTAQELRIIAALLKKDVDISLCLTCGGLEESEEIFEPARKTALMLLRLASENGVATESVTLSADAGRAAALSYLEKHLFTYDTETCSDEDGAVRVVAAPSPDAELEAAAAAVTELLWQGYRLRDIAVAVCDWDAYGALAEDVFTKYGVPVFVSGKSDIGRKPPVFLIEKALEIVTDGWEFDAVFAYLKTGLTGLCLSDCDALENYALKWNLRGGIWTRDEDWTLPPTGYERGPDDEEAAQLSYLNTLRKTVVPPLKRLQSALKASDIFGDKLAALYGFMEELELPARIAEKSELLASAGELQLADAYAQLWELLVRALDQFYDILGDKTGGSAEFARLWKLLVSQYDMGSIPVALDRVSLGDMSRIRRRGCKCLIVVGASDDALPATTGGGAILTDSERRELPSLGLAVANTAEERLFRALSLVYSALTIPTERLVVSYSRTDAGGGEKRPSFVVRRLAALFNLPTQTDTESRFRLAAAGPAFELAASYFNNPDNPSAAAAAAYFRHDASSAERLLRLAEGAEKKRGSMTGAQASKLYGSTLTVSASRIDKYYACRFLYFLQYGLNARPRKPAGFDAPTAGTFMHYVLESTTREIRDGAGFANVTDSECLQLTRKYVDRYVVETLDNFKDKSSRFKYLFERLAENASFVVLDMVRELRCSDFVPLDFELEFSDNGKVPPHAVAGGGAEVKVKGFVDRVDGWAHDGKLYLRVVDYKTGKKTFSLSDVLHGMNMQMLIYLFALGGNGKITAERLLGTAQAAEIVPAGVLYAPAREEIIPASRYDSDERIAGERQKRLRRSGMLLHSDEVLEAMEHGADKRYLPVKLTQGVLSGDSLATAERLGALARHVDGMLLEIAKGVGGGEIAAEPYFKNQNDNACLYCDYAAACHFNTSEGDRRRFMRKINTEDAWARLSEEAGEQ